MSEKLFKSTAIVSMMTFLSRILGFVRDIVIARLFGAGLGAVNFRKTINETYNNVARYDPELVNDMSEDECVKNCRSKVAGFLGEEKAKEFDSI